MSDRIARRAREGVVISADCGSFKTHDPHVLRKGFLGIGGQKCEGYVHRHFWKLDPIRHYFNSKAIGRPFFLFTVNWKCHCGDSQSISRQGLYSELLGKKA